MGVQEGWKRTPKLLICQKFQQNLKKIRVQKFRRFLTNINEIVSMLLSAYIRVYYVMENALNIYKINKLFLVTSCFILWELVSKQQLQKICGGKFVP